MSASPRLPPRPIGEWDEEARSAVTLAFGERVFDRWTGPDAAPVPTVLGALLHHPPLATKWLAFSNVLLATPAVGARHRELMVLRVAWRTRAWCEWVQHVLMAERCDITPADISAIAADSFADGWTSLERDLVTATDELLDDHSVGDATWARLAGALDEQQLVEVVFIVGSYLCLALAFNSFELEMEEGVDLSGVPRFPD